MRLFIAIDLDNEEYFKNIQKQINSENAKIKLVNSFHLTLKFLGYVSKENLVRIKDALKQIKFEKFNIKTTKIGVFPNENFIRVVWLGLKPEDKILELKEKVDKCLEGISSKEKEFKPHLTLARVKFIKDKQSFINNLKNIKIKEKEFEVNSIKLIKSTLTPEGPVYDVLAEFP